MRIIYYGASSIDKKYELIVLYSQKSRTMVIIAERQILTSHL